MKTKPLSAREVDAMVAEKVMGWVWKRFYRWGEPDETRTLVDPMDNWLTAPQYVICDLSVKRERNLDTRFHGPNFSTDASADYTVLEHAMKWPFSKRQAFANELDKLLRPPLADGCVEVYPNAAMKYRVGFYSRAALAVVEATRSVTK